MTALLQEREKEEDEDTRFAATLVDVLRHMPPGTKHEARRTLYVAVVDILLKAQQKEKENERPL